MFLIFKRNDGSATRVITGLDKVIELHGTLVWFRQGKPFGFGLSMQHLCASFDHVVLCNPTGRNETIV